MLPVNKIRRLVGRVPWSYLACAALICAAGCAGQEAGKPGAEILDPVELLRLEALALDAPEDLDPLIMAAGDRRLVLLGEASHGTSEFYAWRTEISRRLIREKGFRFIAVEGDWAACYRLDRYVKGNLPARTTARDLLRGFTRWPTWMWGNEEVVELIEWLRDHNAGLPPCERVGFYGIDVYDEVTSLRKVLALLPEMAPDLVPRVQGKYACLQPYTAGFNRYAQAVARGRPSCEAQARAVVDLLREAVDLRETDPVAYFNLEQNALVVKHAERHYRSGLYQGPASWNSRVEYFYRTATRLLDHHGGGARGIVWAHNTHIGDASATAMADRGEYNIGQLARQHLGREDVFAVGFGTHRGTVMAGRSWGATPEVMTVPAAVEGSFEDLLHRTEIPRLLLLFDDSTGARRFAPLSDRIGHRAIGVVYRPEQERFGNYVGSVVPRRYDAFIYIEETRAVRPVL